MRMTTTRDHREQRKWRSEELSLALHFQLAACVADGEVAAMAMADEDGIPLAIAGDLAASREAAKKLAAVAARIQSAEYRVLGDGQCWDVSMQKVTTDGGDVVVCAIGGSAHARKQRIARTSAAAQRIITSR